MKTNETSLNENESPVVVSPCPVISVVLTWNISHLYQVQSFRNPPSREMDTSLDFSEFLKTAEIPFLFQTDKETKQP